MNNHSLRNIMKLEKSKNTSSPRANTQEVTHRKDKKNYKTIWKSMFKARDSYKEKSEMAIEKRKKTSYNGTKETNKKRW